jgi:hypothetical protein
VTDDRGVADRQGEEADRVARPAQVVDVDDEQERLLAARASVAGERDDQRELSTRKVICVVWGMFQFPRLNLLKTRTRPRLSRSPPRRDSIFRVRCHFRS